MLVKVTFLHPFCYKFIQVTACKNDLLDLSLIKLLLLWSLFQNRQTAVTKRKCIYRSVNSKNTEEKKTVCSICYTAAMLIGLCKNSLCTTSDI